MSSEIGGLRGVCEKLTIVSLAGISAAQRRAVGTRRTPFHALRLPAQLPAPFVVVIVQPKTAIIYRDGAQGKTDNTAGAITLAQKDTDPLNVEIIHRCSQSLDLYCEDAEFFLFWRIYLPDDSQQVIP